MNTKTSYTAGPWAAVKVEDLTAYNIFTGGGVAMCQVEPTKLSQPSAEVAANARLIAAAPETTKALRDMTSLLEKILYAHDTDNNGAAMGEAVLCEYFAKGARCEIDAARAALAKAGAL